MPWPLAAGALLGAGAMVALTITAVTITNRYLGDFFALMVVGTALAAPCWLSLQRRSGVSRIALPVAAVGLVVWAVIVNVSLHVRLMFGA